MSIGTIGLDIAKQFFQVPGPDAVGRAVHRRNCVGIKLRPFLQTCHRARLGIGRLLCLHYDHLIFNHLIFVY